MTEPQDTGDQGLDAFNRLPGDDAEKALDECLGAPGWPEAVAAGRPYPDRRALLTAATRAAADLPEEAIAVALLRHPRIGDRPTEPGREASFSRSEQGGVDGADAILAAALRAGNLEYEERFGHVFLIRAAGRSGPEMLAALNERLTHSYEQERPVVRQQLTEIALLRLAKVLEG